MCAKQLVKSAMIVVLALLLFYGSAYVHCATVPQNSTDMLALIDFRKAITSDDRGFFSSWNHTVDYCNWSGITCSRTHPGRVRELNITGKGLVGQISPSLGNLTLLKILDLSSNSLLGLLPNLSHLRRLQILRLGHNNLQGFAPDALKNHSNLKVLNLGGNKLAGAIPPELGFFYNNLLVLNLQSNSFTGTTPPSLGNITQLSVLFLLDNQLEGSIPTELGQLSKLTNLALGENRLSDSIPTTLLNHTKLATLDVNTNLLRMALPSTFGNTLPALYALGLKSNMFYGQIPASLGNVQNLAIIDFSSNSFTGQIPSSLGNLTLLQTLILDQNKLEANDSKSWEFLDALSSCNQLQTLTLYDNQLQGALPNSIGKLSPSLQFLGLDKNNLSGTVPESIGNLNLTTLYLAENNLAGPIELWVGKLKNLGKLDLTDNNFSGRIPSSLGSFAMLTELYLQNNNFDGPIPASLANLQYLSVLDLSFNNLHGPISKDLFRPKSTMTRCLLSYNNLEGPIPPEISNLQQQLNELHLSSNKLTGDIPPTLGQCHQLEILKMDNNFLTGTILFLSSLTSLSILNLSHNNLSGSIPIELGNMSSLAQLDLSYNDLQGKVPRDGVFLNASAVSLVGNKGLCGGGMLDLHIASCPTASRRKVAQYYLVRVLIPIFGFMALLTLIYFVLTKKNMVRAPSLSPLGDQFPIVSYNDLAEATKNFSESNLIGRGSCGSVYRGDLTKKRLQVAVKVLDLDMRDAEKSFLSECQALRNIRHRNLVPIITACSTVDVNGNVFKALVYEFMPNGNLDTCLHQKGDREARKPLSLNERACLAVNIADILDYLHHESGRTIVHCDVKPSNILLDNDMNARLGDFGIAKFYLDSRSQSTGESSIGVKGTIGYIAPEYARGAHASTYGDVYSFGIVLLEMLTGKRPTDNLFVNELNIVSFVEKSFPDKILDVIDTPLQDEVKTTQVNMVTENRAYQCLFSLLQVALSCTRQLPGERATMREAANRIRAIKTTFAGGKHKHALK